MLVTGVVAVGLPIAAVARVILVGLGVARRPVQCILLLNTSLLLEDSLDSAPSCRAPAALQA